MITAVISGGQIGADIAGLRAAREAGLETGGWVSKGFRTLAGPAPYLGEVYGLKETESYAYPPRTYANVRDADATVRFASNFNSRGELCTLKAIRKYRKPYFDVTITGNGSILDIQPRSARFAAWLRQNRVTVLNVAGNAKPEYEELIEEYLLAAIRSVNC